MAIGYVCVIGLDRSSWALEHLPTTLVPGKLCSSDTDTSIGYADTPFLKKAMTQRYGWYTLIIYLVTK